MNVQIKVYVQDRAELELLIKELETLSMAYVIETVGILEEGAKV